MMNKTALFIPCSVNLLLPWIGEAVDRVLKRLDVVSVYPDRQTCCGQMVYNKGFFNEARSFATHFLDVFESFDAVVCPSGSCTAMVKHRYPSLFDDDPKMKQRALDMAGRVFEFSQYLVDVLGVTDTGASFSGKVAYHDSCHLSRDLGVSLQPRTLIRAAQGTELVVLNNGDQCCGFGGEFSVSYPDISTAMVSAKAQSYLDSGADLLVVGEPGCLLNIGTYLEKNHPGKQVLHIAEFLDCQGGENGR